MHKKKEVSVAITVEKVSKLYRLGLVGTGTISQDLGRFLARLRGKEDPFTRLSDDGKYSDNESSEFVWSLKDVSFSVDRGDTFGIIGLNGSGKSTLLKILSRVTGPTTGHIKVRGRLASLLEVGTGFHPELTGRENIFLNGAILGMKKLEIQNKLDEIIDFSGVSKYIDTPVKRYSSGMYVRLAFAVAAHLESEILLVDEVLAVGDFEFQKKCLGKMKDISGVGRTVLFVSHNMGAVNALCNKGILLSKGTLKAIGPIQDVIKKYNSRFDLVGNRRIWEEEKAPGGDGVKILEVDLSSTEMYFYIENEIRVRIVYRNSNPNQTVNLSVALHDSDGNNVLTSHELSQTPLSPGLYENTCLFPPNFFNSGHFFISVIVMLNQHETLCNLEQVISFNMQEKGTERGSFLGRWNGIIRPKFSWSGPKPLIYGSDV